MIIFKITFYTKLFKNYLNSRYNRNYLRSFKELFVDDLGLIYIYCQENHPE